MSAIIFNGRETAKKEEEELFAEIQKLGKIPRLVSILSSDNKESLLYTSLKQKAAQRVGIPFEAISLPVNLPVPRSSDEHRSEVGRSIGHLGDLISGLNSDNSIGGILVQLPFFDSDDDLTATSLISPEKDVDCLTPFNLGLIQLGQPQVLPATVRAILEILSFARPASEKISSNPSVSLDLWDAYKSHLSWIVGKKVVIVGSRGMVGAPLLTILSYMGATVTGCHRQTKNLAQEVLQGDIVISSAGSPQLIKKDMIKPGAIVIDVGTSVLDGLVHGDIDPAATEVASFLTPVPGGVGPMTVISLLKNFVDIIKT